MLSLLKKRRWLRSLPLLAALTLLCAATLVDAASPDADRDELGQCKRGFYAMGQVCLPVEMPENARLDSTGHAWICRNGFYEAGKQCLPVKIPAHARLDTTGHAWVCEKGYYLVGEKCEIVCERGFHNQGETCVPTANPAHAPAANIPSAPRECPRGTRDADGRCEKFSIPAHAALDKNGHEWACDTGFFRYGEECRRVCDTGFFRDETDTCRALVVPPNASLDRGGHNWTCNPGFIAQGESCVPVPLDTPPVKTFGSGGAKASKP
jgi:hypothetical protein